VGALGDAARAASPLLLAAVVAAGALTAVQQGLNGRMRAVTGDATVATAVNFLVGTAALLLGVALRAAVTDVQLGAWPDEWWLYLGGPAGVVFVASAAVVVRLLGVLRLGLAVIAGQLLGAVALDLLLPVDDAGLSAATAVGAALTLVAAVVSGRRSARTGPAQRPAPRDAGVPAAGGRGTR
jgi:transporter family-2 protein